MVPAELAVILSNICVLVAVAKVVKCPVKIVVSVALLVL
jgi:hypothetical protein|tara:strand:+ start:560 stop:676 length:117 start_codon:yes stop_codon:yes gene_type:complete